ncbi:M16 family metallopeptidase [uncultured Friedmanniella sp.]|uniref:M16 family metallopeptidase n=1 Tax=uncultured Friedmanniella sp. TaxID=335381 RepID=UPI0035C9679B
MSPAAPLAYPIVQRTLTNGLTVIASPDHGTPTVAVNLWYDVGSRDEQPGRTGFAHLFEHLMFQGSTHVPTGQHIGLLQAAGASVNATTWFDRTNYFETLPSGGLDLALWLEADRLGGLLDTMTQESLDNQREVVKEEKRQRYDNVPYGDVMERLIRLTFPEQHPYGHTTIGSMDDLNAATLEDVQHFFRTHYLPSNAVLSIVGDVEPDRAFERADTYFGGLHGGHKPAKVVPAPLPPLTGTERAETTADVPAAAVYLTWRLPARGTPEFDAVDLAFSILGHGQTSRLHRQLVRSAELAESSGASTLGLIGGSSYGFAYGRARDGVEVEQVEAALAAEVDRLVSEPPTERELRRAKAQYERHWLHELARVDSRADAFGEFATLHRNPALVNTRIAEIEAVGLDDLVDVVGSVFRSDQRATLVYRQGSTGRSAA